VTGIEKYIGSGFIKGIWPVMAKRIVKKFKKETLYCKHLKSSSPQVPVQDNETKAGILPGKVIIVASGKLSTIFKYRLS
jgi:hypothetical protein